AGPRGEGEPGSPRRRGAGRSAHLPRRGLPGDPEGERGGRRAGGRNPRRGHERVAEPARQAVAETVVIRSKRFGDYEVPADRVLVFRDGLIGFPHAQRFVLLEPTRPGTPFRYLLCVDLPELGFVVCDARALSPLAARDVPLPADTRPEDVAILAIVTVPA